MHIIDCILQQAVSKIVVDKSKVPYSFYSAFQPLVAEVKSWTDVLDHFDPDTPSTVIEVGWALMDRVIEKPKSKPNPINTFLKKEGFHRPVHSILSGLFESMLQDQELEIVERFENIQIARADLSSDTRVIALISGTEENPSMEIYMSEDDEERDRAYKYLNEFIWEGNTALFLDSDEGEFKISPYIFSEREYKGEVLDYIKGLSRYIDQTIRRVVILQGVPGTGKSTLCSHVAKVMGKPTVVMSSEFLMDMPREDWVLLLKVVNPTIAIIDDIDRIGQRSLEQNLYMFEDAYYQVPLTLMTTNDQRSLPTAFRRPGRVDQIIDMPTPEGDICREVVREIASMEGINEIPDSKLEFLVEINEKFPGAHLVELLRRYKVEGWDYEIPKNDITFGDDFSTLKMKEVINKTIEAI